MKKLKQAVSYVLVFLTVFSSFTILPSEFFNSALVSAAEIFTEDSGAEKTQPTSASGWNQPTGATESIGPTWPDYEYSTGQEWFAETYTEGDFVYSLINNETELQVVNYTGSDTHLVIPSVATGSEHEEIAGKKITAIYKHAFSYNSSIEKVTLPETIQVINSYAFSSCSNLKEINLAECNNLVYIAFYAFQYTNLTSVTLPESLLAIGGSTFYSCYSLTTVDMSKCTKLESMKDYIFSYCEALQTVIFPENITSIPERMFSSCNLTEIDLSKYKNLKSIEYGAFQYSGNLKSVVLPDSIENIEYGAFYYCESLKSINIPANLTSLGESVFSGCNALENFIVSEDNPNYSSEDGVLFNKNKTTLILCPSSKSGDYVVPTSVLVISSEAFYKCGNLTSVDMSKCTDLKSIGSNAFAYSGITEVSLPKNLETIGDSAFYNLPIEEITIPSNVKTIDNYAFSYCEDLVTVDFSQCTKLELIGYRAFSDTSVKEITIPETVTTIDGGIFANCTNLEKVNLKNCTNLDNIGSDTFYNTAISSIELPKSIKTIYGSAFADCDNLTTVNFAECTNLETIGYSAFAYTGITELNLPKSVKIIENYAFNNCDNLTEIDFSNYTNLTTLGYGAFIYCDGLESVNLSNCTNLETVGWSLFNYCRNLKTINMSNCTKISSIEKNTFSSCDNLTTLDLSNCTNLATISNSMISSSVKLETVNLSGCSSITAIPNDMFSGFTKLNTVTLPSTVTSIGSKAFYNCSRLLNINLSECKNLETIGSSAFYGCSSLKSLNLSECKNLQYIQDTAFYKCVSLKTVNLSNCSKLSYINFNAFGVCTALTELNLSNCTSLTYISKSIIVESGNSVSLNLSNCTGLTYIDNRAFSSCPSLSSINLSGCVNLYSIGSYAFEYCPNLTTVNLSGCTKLSDLGYSMFNKSDNLTEVDLSGCTSLTNIDGSFSSNSMTKLNTVNLSGCTGLSCLDSYIFNGYTGLTNLDLSGCTGLSYIGGNAFINCKSLKFMDLSSCTNLTTIYYDAFENCSSLTGVILPESITSIGSNAFYNCTSLSVVQILSKNVSDIYANSFTGCNPTFYCYENSTTHKSLVKNGFTNIKFITGKVDNLAITYLSSNTATIEWEKPYGPYNTSHYIIYKDGEKLTETDNTKYTATNLTVDKEYVFAVVTVYTDGAMSELAEIIVKPNYPKVDNVTLPNNGTVGGLEKVKLTATMSDKISSKGGKGVFMYAYGALKDGEEMEDDAWLEATDWYYACDAQQISNSANFVGYWDLTDLTTGDYCLKFVFTGKDGDTSTYYCRANVDRTHPQKIDEPMIIPDASSISIAWQVAKEVDTTGYKVYRSVDNSKDYELIAELAGRETKGYTDKNVEKGKIYSYYVVAVDQFNQESLTYDIISAGLIDDVVEPTFTKMTPANTSYIYRNMIFNVYATDNVGVTKTELYYSYSLEDDKSDWVLLATSNGSYFNKAVDTTVINDGVVYIRAKIYDAMGNYTLSPSYQYICDNKGPEKVTGVKCIEASGANLTLSWNDVTDVDRSYFYVEKLNSNGSYTVVYRAGNTLGANLSGLTPETEYTFRVVAYDKYDNRGVASEPITVTTTKDTHSPVVTDIYSYNQYNRGNIGLYITALDDYAVKSIRIETSADKENWQHVETIEINTLSAQQTVYYVLDTTKYDEGSLYVRAIAVDTYNNETPENKLSWVEYIIDRTPAKLPVEFTVSSDNDYASLQWSGMESDSSFAYYRIYRSETEDGVYRLIKDRLTTVNYYDTNVEYGKEYYYKIRTYDKAGNESELSKAVYCKIKEDEEPPKIYGISPSDGSPLGEINSTLTVVAEDNAKINNLKVEYMVKGLFSSYTTLKEVTGNTTSYCEVSAKLPIEQFADGDTVLVRVTAVDKAGNPAEELIATYTVDKTPPTVNNLNVTQGEDSKITLNWQSKAENDVVCYYIYRQINNSNDYVLYTRVLPVAEQTNYTFTDTITDPECFSISYKVEAYDKIGNNSSQTTESIEILANTKPIIKLNCKTSVIAESEYIYDASASIDNGQITNYTFDFGNGDIVNSSNGNVTYAYSKSGTYTLAITAIDNDGEASTLKQTITVSTRELSNTITIKVVDDKNSPVNYAPVYIDLGEETTQKGYTNYYGEVTFEVSVGTHIVASYKDSYLPVKKQIVVTGGKSYTELVLVKQPIVTGTFEIHKMSFEEIKAANIDINAPENRNVVKFEVQLEYLKTPVKTHFYYNGTDILHEQPQRITLPNGDVRQLTPSVISRGEDAPPVVVYVDVPVEMSFVKEFFDVSLHIVNNATEEFSLVNNTVTLNVPDGLTIMNVEGYNSQIAEIAEIKGQSQETLRWILRGDKRGEYPISADFLGTLSYINQPVTATFKSEEPIVVEGAASVKATVETCEHIFKNKVLYNVVIENTGDGDLNGFAWRNLVEPYGVEFEDVNGNRTEMKTQKTVLKPGEKFIYHYFAKINRSYTDFTNSIVKDISSSGAEIATIARPLDDFKEYYFKKFPEESGKFIMYVKDSSGNPVTDAVVTIGETEMITDEEGRAVLPDRKIKGSTLTVEKDGYYTYTEDDYHLYVCGKDDNVTLYKEGETVIASVMYENENVLISDGKILQGAVDNKNIKENTTFEITAYGNVNSIELIQGGKTLATVKENNGKDYKYTITYNTNSFEENQYIYIVLNATDADGKEVRISKKLLLDVTFMANLNSTKFPIISGIDITIGDGSDEKDEDKKGIFTLLGGAGLSFQGMDISGISVIYDYEEKKYIVNVNVDLKPADYPNLKSYREALHKKYEEFKKTKKIEKDKPVDTSFELAGVIEIGISKKGKYYIAKDCLTLSASISYGKDFNFKLGVVPVTAGFKITGKASTEIGIECNVDEQEFNWLINNIKVGAELRLSAGVGFSVLSAGVYGKAAVDFNITFPVKPKIESVVVSGEIGLYAKAFILSGEWPIFKLNDYPLYPRDEKDSKAKALSEAMASVYSADSYSLNNKILDYNATWENPILTDLGTTTLVENVYAYSKPQIITCGNDTIMVYLGTDKESQKATNAMTMYCSVYNKDTGKWGVPTKIDKNNQLDMAYSLCTDGEKIYLVYAQANKMFEDNVTLEEITESGDLYTAVFDSNTKKFTDFTQLTNNSTFDCNPVVKIVNGVPTAVWVNNSNNNTFLTDSDNSIMMSTCENGVWSQPQAIKENLNTLQNLNLMNTGKGTAVVYTTDGDCDLTTVDDKTLYAYYLKTDSTIEIDTQLETAVVAEEIVNAPVVIWYKDGELNQYNLNTNNTKKICNANEYIADGFKVVTDNNGNYAIVYVQDKTSVCVMYLDTETLSWTTPVTVATTKNVIENLEAQYVNGNLTLMYHDTLAEPKDGVYQVTSKMVATVVSSDANAVINNIDVDLSKAVPSSKAEAEVTVTNTGATATGNLTFNVINYDGMSLGTYTTENVSLASGETATYKVEFLVPSYIVNRDITVTVTDSSKKYINSNIFCLAKCDYSINVKHLVQSDGDYIYAEFANNLYYSSPATIEVYNKATNEVYYSINTSGVSAGDKGAVKIPLDEKYMDADRFVCVRIVPVAEDYLEYNNTDMCQIFDDKEEYDLNGITVNNEEIADFAVDKTEYTVIVDDITNVKIVPNFNNPTLTYEVTAENNIYTINMFNSKGENVGTYTITVEERQINNFAIVGDVNLELTKADAGNFVKGTIYLDNGSYKIKVSSKGKELGYNKTVDDVCTNLTFNANYSAYLTLNATGGEYTFIFNTVTNKLSIEYRSYDITGDINLKLHKTEDNIVTGTATLNSGLYKIKVNAKGTELGYNKAINDVCTNLTFNANYSAYLTLNATGGEYTFIFNTATNKLTIKHKGYEITGDINLKLNKTQDNIATATVTLNSGSYKIKVNDRGTELGYNKAIDDVCTNLSFKANYSAYLTLNATGGEYTFIFNTATNKLTIKYKGYEITGDINLKLKQTENNIVTATATLNSGSYKIKVNAKGTELGYNKAINDVCTNLTFNANYSAYLTLNATGGEYTFIFNTTTNKLTIKYKGYSITGDINLQLKDVDDTITMAETTLEKGLYKIKVNVNGTQYGYNKTITNAYSNMSFNSNYSAYMTLNATGGTYTFIFDKITNKLTVKHKGYGITGDINLHLKETDNGTATAETTLNSGSYKIKVALNGTEMGYNKVIDDICSGLTFKKEYSAYLTLNATGGKYTFVLDTANNRLTIKKSGICIMGDINLQFDNVSSERAMSEIKLQAGTYKIKVNNNGTQLGYNKTITDTCNGLSVKKDYQSYITFNATGGIYSFIFDKKVNKLVIKKVRELPNAYLIGDLDTVLNPVKGRNLAMGTAYLDAGDYNFKLSIGGVEFGYNKIVTDSTTGSMSFNSKYTSQVTLKATGGMYTFVLNTLTNKLDIRHTSDEAQSKDDVHISGDFDLVLNDKSANGTDLTIATGKIKLDQGTYTFKVYNHGTVYTGGVVINDVAMKTLSNKYTTPVTLNATGGTYKFKFDKETGALTVSMVG